jgi:hypothetical protein
MTRSDLVEELANRFGQLTHRDAEFAVKAILDAMNDALVAGTASRSVVLAVSPSTTARPAWVATRAAAKVWPSPKSAYRISNPARPCVSRLTSALLN